MTRTPSTVATTAESPSAPGGRADPARRTTVVVVGGGFGGLYAARDLGKLGLRVVLIDRVNYHLFQPLLYQVATASLSPGDIAEPLRAVLRRYRKVHVLLGEVTRIDPDQRC